MVLSHLSLLASRNRLLHEVAVVGKNSTPLMEVRLHPCARRRPGAGLVRVSDALGAEGERPATLGRAVHKFTVS
jgi:hypothetical protein